MTSQVSQTPDTTTGTPAPRDALIESIYRIALEPQTYDSFMGHWDTYITEQLQELDNLRASDATRMQSAHNPEIGTHFEIAARLLDQMGRPEPEMPGPHRQRTRNPQVLIDGGGRLVWRSAAAEQLFALPPLATIADLGLSDTLEKALGDMAAQIQGGSSAIPPAPLVLPVIPKTALETPLYMVARPISDKPQDGCILLTKITPDWPPEMARLLQKGFGLTDAEVEICEGVADGKGPAEIAQGRGNALATVRTQLKNLMGKTRCSTQAELVRLLHSIMRVADQDPGLPARQWSASERVTSFALPDRQMMIEHYGDPDGYPVVFFHGMLDGNSMTYAFQAELRRHNLRLICPVRPWFGAAPGSVGPPETAAQRFGADIAQLLRGLEVKKPIFLGHMAGALYAFASAAALDDNPPRGIVNVAGGVPIVSLNQFSSMSRRQRLVAYTARYTPAILPFVVRAGISQMDNGGNRAFLHSLYESTPDDMQILADPEIRDLVLSGYRFTVQQGHKAFEVDGHNVVRDWSALADATKVPVKLLHGASDPVVSAESVRAFAAHRGNRISLEVMDGAGQLLLYKHHKKVIAALCAMRDGTE